MKKWSKEKTAYVLWNIVFYSITLPIVICAFVFGGKKKNHQPVKHEEIYICASCGEKIEHDPNHELNMRRQVVNFERLVPTTNNLQTK